MPDLIPIADLDLSAYDLTPAFAARSPAGPDHLAYLEAVHESTHRNLANIHLCLAKGEVDYATDMLRALRVHIEALWDEYRAAVQGGGS